MIPVSVFSSFDLFLAAWLCVGILVALIWSVFLIFEPKSRASFRRSPWIQGTLLSALLLPLAALLGIFAWVSLVPA